MNNARRLRRLIAKVSRSAAAVPGIAWHEDATWFDVGFVVGVAVG